MAPAKLVLVWLALAACSVVAAIDVEAQVGSAQEFKQALLDPHVTLVSVAQDLDLAPLALKPDPVTRGEVFVGRNVTVQGPAGQYPALAFHWWQNATWTLRLGPGITMRFQNLLFKGVRNFAPDMIAGGMSTDTRVELEDIIIYRYTSLPLDYQESAARNAERAPWATDLPANLADKLPGGYCRVSPSPTLCWEAALALWDAATQTTRYGQAQNSSELPFQVSVRRVVSVSEQPVSGECAAAWLNGQLSCVMDASAVLQAEEAASPTGWLRSPAPPYVVERIMAAYQELMWRALNRTRARQEPQAGSQPEQSRGRAAVAIGLAVGLSVAAVIAIVIVVMLVMLRRHRSNQQRLLRSTVLACGMEDKLPRCSEDCTSGSSLDNGHTLALSKGACAPAYETCMDTTSSLDQQQHRSREFSGATHDNHASSACVGVDCCSVTNPAVHVGCSSMEGSGVVHLQHYLTPAAPLSASLPLDVCVGRDVTLGPLIGVGGMGRVYQSEFRGGRVAVKVLAPGPSLRCLEHELSILGRTQHPNVVRLLGANLSGEQPLLVEELADGSLEQLLYPYEPRAPISSHGPVISSEPRAPSLPSVSLPLPLDTVLSLAIEICTGLAYLHPTIIHRDLKPGNVLLMRTDRAKGEPGGVCVGDVADQFQVKLSDFELSRILDTTTLVTQRPYCGTLPYMAPECFAKEKDTRLTHKCDVYSFGILLWEMLHGTRPWAGYEPVQVVYEVVINGERPRITAPPERCPRQLRRLLLRCWDVDPHRRPPALEVVRELALLQQQLRTYGTLGGDAVDTQADSSPRAQPVSSKASSQALHEAGSYMAVMDQLRQSGAVNGSGSGQAMQAVNMLLGLGSAPVSRGGNTGSSGNTGGLP